MMDSSVNAASAVRIRNSPALTSISNPADPTTPLSWTALAAVHVLAVSVSVKSEKIQRRYFSLIIAINIHVELLLIYYIISSD